MAVSQSGVVNLWARLRIDHMGLERVDGWALRYAGYSDRYAGLLLVGAECE